MICLTAQRIRTYINICSTHPKKCVVHQLVRGKRSTDCMHA
uniref:Uncharacterized protein n=1 Tax=Arundo donax TaxID=35708 RepID=A0A0A8Y1R6_ARUDO